MGGPPYFHVSSTGVGMYKCPPPPLPFSLKHPPSLPLCLALTNCGNGPSLPSIPCSQSIADPTLTLADSPAGEIVSLEGREGR